MGNNNTGVHIDHCDKCGAILRMYGDGAKDMSPTPECLVCAEIANKAKIKLESKTPLTVDDIIFIAHSTAKEKGWWPKEGRNDFECMALIHSEISEAVEDLREGKTKLECVDGKPCGLPSELADAIIRIADYCGKHKIDLEFALRKKLEYNKTRPHRHGGKLA